MLMEIRFLTFIVAVPTVSMNIEKSVFLSGAAFTFSIIVDGEHNGYSEPAVASLGVNSCAYTDEQHEAPGLAYYNMSYSK